MSLQEVYRGASPQRQLLMVALIAVVICAVLATVYALVLRRPYEVLFSNLRTMDAATIVGELDKKKVPYKLRDGGATILVPEDQVNTVRLNIMSEDLPIKGMVGFELFNKSDVGLTEFAQKINYQRALQGELARTIMTMDAVDTARVHLSLPEPTIFREDKRAPKASVTLLTRPGKQLSPDLVRGVQRLVAAAVADLNVADVVILNEHGAVISPDVVVASAASPQAQKQHAIEEYYAAKIRQAVAPLYPKGDVEVAVVAAPDANITAGTPNQPDFEAWSPAARTFPLRVTLSVATLPPAPVESQIRSLTATAVGPDPGLGDLINVEVSDRPYITPDSSPAPPAVLPVRPTDAGAPRPSAAGMTPTGVGLALASPVLILLLALAFVLGRRRTAPRRLTARQTDDYVHRFAALLDRGGGHDETTR